MGTQPEGPSGTETARRERAIADALSAAIQHGQERRRAREEAEKEQEATYGEDRPKHSGDRAAEMGTGETPR
jgi:hypothetical protein